MGRHLYALSLYIKEIVLAGKVRVNVSHLIFTDQNERKPNHVTGIPHLSIFYRTAVGEIIWKTNNIHS